MWWRGRAAAFVGWFVVWTLAELLVNITRLLCLTAVVVAAATAVGVVGWGDDLSETTFRISQSLFFLLSDGLVCNSSALGLFSND